MFSSDKLSAAECLAIGLLAVSSVVPGAKYFGRSRTATMTVANRKRNYGVTSDVLNLLQFDTVWTVYHMVIYMQSNKIHKVF